MARKNQKTNPVLMDLIHDLKKNAYEQQTPLWKDIAERLERPLQTWPVVNLDRINNTITDKETALIPGKVLSDGALTKKTTIAAWMFSDNARKKISDAGSTPVTIQKLVKDNPKGKNIRIVG